MKYYLGIDVGTSGTKVLGMTPDGEVRFVTSHDYPLDTPKNGWAQQDPALWEKAAVLGLREACEAVGAVNIAAIGITGQMHGLVPMDNNGKVLYPAMLWCDQRTEAECREITETIGASRLIELTANPALTGFTAPKILWLRKNEPDIYSKIEHILLPKDYIRYILSGELATDVSDASGMGLLDVAHRTWSDEVLNKLGIPAAWLPKLYESVEVSAVTSKLIENLTGIKAGTPIIAGAGDNAAAAIGTGICKDGEAFVTIGSSGVVFAHTSTMITEPGGRVHSFCSAVPGEWHTMGVTLAAGLSMKWFRSTMCPQLSYDEITALARQSTVGANRLYYLPYLNGERTPHLDPNIRGAFLGLSSSHNLGDLARAVLEGVTFSLRDCFEIISGLGTEFRSITACGGGSVSPFWRKLITDILGVPVNTVQTSEGPALGAAMLAAAGTGELASVGEACERIVKRSEAVTPDAALHAEYSEVYDGYRRLYPVVATLR